MNHAVLVVSTGAVLAPLLALAGSPRFARLGDFDGSVETQVHAADAWRSAVRNTPLVESSWVRTGGTSRVEIELDDGGALRLAGDSLAELSDYSRLSTGQRITLISLDRGVAYFTGEPGPHDVLTVAVPGGQVTLRQGCRLRFDTGESSSRIAVLEGVVRLSTAAAEMDLREGQIVRLPTGIAGRFTLDREIPALDSDRWNEDRDKAAAHSQYALPMHDGLMDLDRYGAWMETGDYGLVWKPKVPAGWAPFQDGKWEWYDEIGYTWISAETWGWTPYHHGRWVQDGTLGWIWAPGRSGIFKPGDVYWLRATNLAGWGPLAVDENWTGTDADTPRLYAAANTTFAKFQPGLREIDPATLATKPKEIPKSAVFAPALPSPPLVAARLDAVRPVLRAGSTRIVPFVTGESYQARSAEAKIPEAAPEAPSRRVSNDPQPTRTFDPPASAPEPEPDTFYPVPVYTGIVILNPPERGRKRDRDPHPERRPYESDLRPPEGGATGEAPPAGKKGK